MIKLHCPLCGECVMTLKRDSANDSTWECIDCDLEVTISMTVGDLEDCK